MIETEFLSPRTELPKVNVTFNGVTTSVRLDELASISVVFTRFGLSFIVSPLDD